MTPLSETNHWEPAVLPPIPEGYEEQPYGEPHTSRHRIGDTDNYRYDSHKQHEKFTCP